MNCPVCNRTLAPTLSICLTCGAMMNDSVREELQTKISAPSIKIEHKPEPPIVKPPAAPMVQPPPVTPPRLEVPRPAPPLKTVTSGFSAAKTSPTLVEFQAKNAVVPDWRLQLQNTVRQRKDNSHRTTEHGVEPAPQARLVTSGANALKAEMVEEPKPQPQATAEHSNPRVANALKRIADSRKTFLPETPRGTSQSSQPVSARSYPFNVVSRNAPPSPNRPVDGKPILNEPPKPKLVSTFRIEKREFDTNKLPKITPESKIVEEVETPTLEIKKPKTPLPAPLPEISIHVTKTEEEPLSEIETGEIEDLAPISMRFNAGLFDLIIGAFASFVLLSPVIFMGGEWFSASGLLAFAATWSIVMFVYLTLAVGMYGKTFGMRMFALELVDADENDYPTFHQAAVSSAVYLLMIPFLGAGFIPLFFNDEQRAAHDLASGTIIVHEF